MFLNNYKNINSVENKNKGIFFFTYIDAIYISNDKNIELFKNEKVSHTLSKIFKEMENKKALIKHYNNRGHFSYSLKIRSYSDPLLKNLAFEENTDVVNLKRNLPQINNCKLQKICKTHI